MWTNKYVVWKIVDTAQGRECYPPVSPCASFEEAQHIAQQINLMNAEREVTTRYEPKFIFLFGKLRNEACIIGLLLVFGYAFIHHDVRLAVFAALARVLLFGLPVALNFRLRASDQVQPRP